MYMHIIVNGPCKNIVPGDFDTIAGFTFVEASIHNYVCVAWIVPDKCL